MFHEEDADRMCVILGTTDPPRELEAEYDRWLLCARRGGKTGPLGADLVTCLLMAAGYEPKGLAVKEESKVDWSRVPLGHPVKIGDVYGEFAGMVGAGTVGVKVSGHAMVREFRSSEVVVVESGLDKVKQPEERHNRPQCGPYHYGDKVSFMLDEELIEGDVVGYETDSNEVYVSYNDDTVQVPVKETTKAK